MPNKPLRHPTDNPFLAEGRSRLVIKTTFSQNSKISENPPSRNQSLDSLRAIACFLVIWQHVPEVLAPIAKGGMWTGHVANYFDFGRIGVIAFFCISGYVIPSAFKGAGLAAARDFAINRFFRLYPAYWVSLIIGLYVIWQAAGTQLSSPALASNALMVANFCGHPHVMGHYWTLEIELVFYIAFAAIFFLLPKNRFIGAVIGFALSYFLWRSRLLAGYPGSTPGLGQLLAIMFTASCVRCLAGLHQERFFDKSKALRIAAHLFVGYIIYVQISPLAIAISKIYSQGDPSWSRYGWGNLLGILLFAIFLFLKKTPAWLAYLGRCSYSAYLLHSIVFTLLARLWTQASLPHTRLEYFILMTAVLTFALAALSHRYIEQPCIALGKRLAPGIRTTKKPVPTAAKTTPT